MKCWIESLLYSAPKASLEDMKSCNLIVNLKPKTAKSHWYEDVLKDEESVVCESFEIPPGSIKQDTGRGLKDKSKSTKKFCRKIVDGLHKGKQTLLICRDGLSTCGFIAMVCRAWYNGPNRDSANVTELVKQVRDSGDFTSAKAKDQRSQMAEILDFAREIYNCPFLIKKQKL